MRRHLKVVEQSKASQGLRFANLVIDRIALYVIFAIFGVIFALLGTILGIEFFSNILTGMANMDSLTDIVLTSIVAFIYYFCMEYFTKGRTLGKYITGTKVISIDGQKPDLQQVLLRTASRFVPFDALSFLGSNGWHDTWTDTRVVKISDYERARNMENDINSIGKTEEA